MDLQELVYAYKLKPSPTLKSQITVESLPLIKSIVGKISHPGTPLCDRDDLINIGSIGLLQALDSYTLNKDVKFNTFAYYRVRGNIIDHIRSIDELSRTKRARYGAAQEAIRNLQQKLGRTPYDREVANEIELDINSYKKLLASVQQRAALSLDSDTHSESDNALSNRLEDRMFDLPDQSLLDAENAEQLREAIHELSEREQLILALYYYEEYNLREIAESLGLSEARISQIIGKMLLTLKASLREYVLV